LLVILKRLGYEIARTYPKNPKEHHHLNFTADPGRVLPPEGPLRMPGKPPKAVQAAQVRGPAPKRSTTKVTLTGPDVSQNQPDVDWAQVAAAGHGFAIAKVSDGLGTPDPAFGKGRWKAMRDAGLIRGAYHFGRPQKGRNPADEVTEFLARLKAAGGLDHGDLVPVLDLEKHGAAGALTATETLDWARQWVAELRKRIGKRPIIYTGVFWRETMRNPADNLDCKLWLAAYVPKAKLPPLIPRAWSGEGLVLWQHTETGRCPGIVGNCDLNRFDGPRAAFDSLRI
jgi:lysozyme